MKRYTLTVIIPCYNESEVLAQSYDCLTSTLSRMIDVEWQLLMINDGSTDATPQILDDLADRDDRVSVIHFSRNFGHQAALTAGMRMCTTDYAVVIDADLQDPPEVILQMWAKMQETGANVIYGVRKERYGETLFKKVSAKLFYRFLNYMSDSPFPVDTGDFRLVDRQVINVFCRLTEHNKYVRGLISWMGFKQLPLYYQRNQRAAGTTKYGFRDMVKLALDAIRYFSDKPLRIASRLGFISVIIGLLLGLWTFLGKVIGFTHPESGWTSIVIIVIFFGGVQLLSIGLLGRYIGVIFEEVKSRPEFIVSHSKNIVTPNNTASESSDTPQ